MSYRTQDHISQRLNWLEDERSRARGDHTMFGLPEEKWDQAAIEAADKETEYWIDLQNKLTDNELDRRWENNQHLDYKPKV